MNLDQHKETAVTLYQMVYEGNSKEAVKRYVGAKYLQHNPAMANGTAGFVDYLERMKFRYPDKSIQFDRAIADGDLVALHIHQTLPGNDQFVTMDFFNLMKMKKSSSIGIPYSRFPRNPQIRIRGIELEECEI